MKSIIIYYSQTSNTKIVAEAIRDGVQAETGQCDLVRLKDVKATDLADYDLIGLGCPVFSFREPLNVRLFVESLDGLEGKHTFIFCTHATILGGFFASLGSALKRMKLELIGWFDCYAGASLQFMPTPWFTDGHPDDQDLTAAREFGKTMSVNHRRILAGETDLIPRFREVPDKPFPTMPPPGSTRRGLQMTLNPAKCTYPICRLCVDECPMEAIDLAVDPPVFRRDCISCYFCEKICPEGAIEVDWERIAQRTAGRIKDVYQRAIEKAEAQGRFRPLVPGIDLDSPYYKVYGKHPRYRV